MNILLISYLIVSFVCLICVFIGYRLLHPHNKLFINLCYLFFIVFFFGRVYEVSRIVLGLNIYNTFELGFLGIVGAFSFLLSSNFSIRGETKIKASKKVFITSLLFSIIIGLMYILILYGKVNLQEKITDFIMILYASSNIYYFMRHLLLIKDDKTGLLKSLKIYNILGIGFSILIDLLLLSFAYNLYDNILVISIFMGADLLMMMLTFKKGVEECKLMN